MTHIKHGGSMSCSLHVLSSKHWEWKTCPHERTATSGRREEYNSLSSVGENARSPLHKRQFFPNGWVAGLWKPEEGKKKHILMINYGAKI